jgi:hypothetical protein
LSPKLGLPKYETRTEPTASPCQWAWAWTGWAQGLKPGPASVATVMTDIFQKNEINLLRKFARIMIIFDNIDDLKNQGVI